MPSVRFSRFSAAESVQIGYWVSLLCIECLWDLSVCYKQIQTFAHGRKVCPLCANVIQLIKFWMVDLCVSRKCSKFGFKILGGVFSAWKASQSDTNTSTQLWIAVNVCPLCALVIKSRPRFTWWIPECIRNVQKLVLRFWGAYLVLRRAHSLIQNTSTQFG